MEKQRMIKVISVMVIFSVSHLSVRGHKQHAANIPAVRHGGLIPLTFDMKVYWYEMMNCYVVKGYPCDPTAFTGHVTCLTKDQVCDGLKQCPNGDDEMGQCGPLAQFCRSDELRCANGKCARPCDGIAECPYGIDELSCNRCDKDELMCSDMKCAKICNGKRECPDGIDERHCLPECKRGEMICPESGKCAQLCDQNAECNKQEDEISCRSKSEKCDLQNLRECVFKSCAKNRVCDGITASLAFGLILGCIDYTSREEGLSGSNPFSRGCGSKEDVINCLCEVNGVACLLQVNAFLSECKFLN